MSCSSFLPRRSRCEAIVFSLFAVLAAIAVTQAFIALTWAGGSSGFFGFGHSPMENVPHPHSTKGAVASMSTRCSDVGA
ncbi:uncharacterized protein K441DRAFT_653721 [Cenococcum geophilum 1.58]|uniref:uncharacterized protein n=1 Tax=Cenococcum geophilum 1.58 TaxID=794803 RepID=UPI00358EC79D|nr:hypothetical protein K441DRAFT_653721 [Cenococcum geophilum 1.58]